LTEAPRRNEEVNRIAKESGTVTLDGLTDEL
jgi:hypothetical protein